MHTPDKPRCQPPMPLLLFSPFSLPLAPAITLPPDMLIVFFFYSILRRHIDIVMPFGFLRRFHFLRLSLLIFSADSHYCHIFAISLIRLRH